MRHKVYKLTETRSESSTFGAEGENVAETMYVISDGVSDIELTVEGAQWLVENLTRKLNELSLRNGISVTLRASLTGPAKRSNIKASNLPEGFVEMGRDNSARRNQYGYSAEYVYLKNEKTSEYGFYPIVNSTPRRFEKIGKVDNTYTPIGEFVSRIKGMDNFSVYQVSKIVGVSWQRLKAMIKILEMEQYIEVANEDTRGTWYKFTPKIKEVLEKQQQFEMR